MNDHLEAALAYARRGWHVLPIHVAPAGRCSCRKPACEKPGKHPRTLHGEKDATTDEATIRRWFEMWPESNVAIGTGARSGLVVVDVDKKNDGEASLRALEATIGEVSPTVEAATGGGGRHLLFAHPGGHVGNRTAVVPGIDVRGDAGYIVAAPSVHASGSAYAWVPGRGPDDIALAALSDRWLERIRGGQNGDRQAAPPVGASIAEGGRNETLASLAGTMRRRGMGEDAILAALLAENAEKCAPPLTEAEVEKIARSIMRYEPADDTARPILESGADTPTAPRSFMRTDLGNAERLIARHGADARFVSAWGAWIIWDRARWKRDAGEEVLKRAADTVRAIYQEAGGAVDEKERKAIAAHAVKSEAKERLLAMIRIARPFAHVDAADLDADAFALNCLNGTVDLKTGALRPHRKEDFITKLAPVAFDPHATSALWERFLLESTGGADGDPELADFLQRAAGYTVSGNAGEEKLFFVHGPAASGKSTFLAALKSALGDYGTTCDFETFLKRKFVGGARNDIADLAGARLVVSIEVDDGRELAEGLVSLVTGQDEVKARFLYKEHFSFLPQFKLWLCANNAPQIRDDSEALWRRVLRVPFDCVVPKEKRDPRLKAELRDVEKSGPAILAWAVRGCLAWQRDGLGIPQIVEAATEELRGDMDPLKDFFGECCGFITDAWVYAGELRGAYEKWAKDRGERRTVSPKDWGERLRSRGCVQECVGNRNTRVWRGIGLLGGAREDGSSREYGRNP